MASTEPVESAKALKGQLDPLDLFDVRSELSDEERMVQGSVGRFVDDKVIPVIRDAFENHYFPADLVPQIAELGLLGSSINGYDCAGLNSVCYGLICQELERGDSGIRSFVSVQSSLVMFPIHAYGSDEQKDRWLPAMARGEAIGCFGLTEAQGGSDPGNMKTHAKRDTDSNGFIGRDAPFSRGYSQSPVKDRQQPHGRDHHQLDIPQDSLDPAYCVLSKPQSEHRPAGQTGGYPDERVLRIVQP